MPVNAWYKIPRAQKSGMFSEYFRQPQVAALHFSSIRQYGSTPLNLFIFRFVSEHCLRSTPRLFHFCIIIVELISYLRGVGIVLGSFNSESLSLHVVSITDRYIAGVKCQLLIVKKRYPLRGV